MKAEKVLCVDDEPSILDAYRRQLRTRFTIVTADSGEEGLAAISKDGPFAVIVSDMRMPGMDGAQFLIASSPSWASTTSCLAVSSILRMILPDGSVIVYDENEGHVSHLLSVFAV